LGSEEQERLEPNGTVGLQTNSGDHGC